MMDFYSPSSCKLVYCGNISFLYRPIAHMDEMMVYYGAVCVSLLLKFLDKLLAAAIGLDIGRQQRYNRFYGGIIVRSSQLLFPFLWAWTITGTVWYICARNSLPDEDAKWSFLVWLLTCYSGLGFHVVLSTLTVLDDRVRVADWDFEAVWRGRRGIGQDDAAYQPGFYVTPAQRVAAEAERVAAEALIRELPKFLLKVVLTDCRECAICLDEFQVGNEVRGLPCAHNFHVECIDMWLRLNVKCPVCRCCVFPNLDLSTLSNIHMDSGRPSSDVTTI